MKRKVNRILGEPVVKTSAIFDEATAAALKLIQNNFGLFVDGIYGPQTDRAFGEYFDRLSYQKLIKPSLLDFPGVVDLSNSGPDPRLASGLQDLNNIRGVTFHQTGCRLGDDHERIKKVNATFYLSQRGFVYLLHDPRLFIWHGHGLSYGTMGIEVEGNFYGEEGKEYTLYKPETYGGPDQVNPDMLRGSDTLFGYLCQLFYLNNLDWDFIRAHRQGSKNRPSCPGESIWKEIALPFMTRLARPNADGGAYTTGSGRPIPAVWDTRRGL
jgi:hypothetical protein